jgi:periplasmic protein TonB
MEWSAPTRPQTLARAPLSAPRATRTPVIAPAAPPFLGHPDRPPRPILVVNPIYPPEDLRARIRGIVVLRVLVSETGVPVEVVIIERARGHLTEAAVAAIRRWRFDPAFKAGEPVREWATVEVPFEALPYPTAAPTNELQTSPTDPGHENAKR